MSKFIKIKFLSLEGIGPKMSFCMNRLVRKMIKQYDFLYISHLTLSCCVLVYPQKEEVNMKRFVCKRVILLALKKTKTCKRREDR